MGVERRDRRVYPPEPCIQVTCAAQARYSPNLYLLVGQFLRSTILRTQWQADHRTPSRFDQPFSALQTFRFLCLQQPSSAASLPRSSGACRSSSKPRPRWRPVCGGPSGCARASSSRRSPAAWCPRTPTTSRPRCCWHASRRSAPRPKPPPKRDASRAAGERDRHRPSSCSLAEGTP